MFDLPSYRAASDVEDYDLEDYGEAAVVPVGLAVATKEVGKLVPLRLKYGPEAA
ncbi:MAG: hypothetical protein KC478_10315 [Bacteriovoracaceae bacterium]|nr:hypothetical protein [Bacteriovoracaceae bacterium]